MHSLCLPLTLCLFVCAVNCGDFTDDESKAIFCTKKLKAISTMVYSPVACMAEAMGADLSTKKPKIPQRVVDRYTANVASVSVLADLQSFMTWMCKDVPANIKLIRKSYEKNPNLSKPEAEHYSSCLVEDVAATIEEDVCVSKSALAISLEKERVNCMKSFAPAKNCAKEMMTGKTVDSIKVESWLCENAKNSEGYIAAEMVCYIGNKDVGMKYLECLNAAVRKLIKK